LSKRDARTPPAALSESERIERVVSLIEAAQDRAADGDPAADELLGSITAIIDNAAKVAAGQRHAVRRRRGHAPRPGAGRRRGSRRAASRSSPPGDADPEPGADADPATAATAGRTPKVSSKKPRRIWPILKGAKAKTKVPRQRAKRSGADTRKVSS
jgi:hypothetical protein